MTNYDTDGAEIDEAAGCFITANSPPESRVHIHHRAVIRLGKAALVAAIEVGAVLHEKRSRRGDDFDNWVDTQLGLSGDEADCYIRFFEESGLRTEQLSAAVEVKLSRVLELLGQLNSSFGKGAEPADPTGTTDRLDHSQPKPTASTAVDNTPTRQAPDPREATSRPVKASKRTTKQTTKPTAKAKPVKQDRDDRQSALTAEQRQFLVRRSPMLFAQVRKGELPAEEALRLAHDLPDRSLQQKSQRR